MPPILLSLLASSSIHWRLTHSSTIMSLFNPLVLPCHLAWSWSKEVIIIIMARTGELRLTAQKLHLHPPVVSAAVSRTTDVVRWPGPGSVERDVSWVPSSPAASPTCPSPGATPLFCSPAPVWWRHQSIQSHDTPLAYWQNIWQQRDC